MQRACVLPAPGLRQVAGSESTHVLLRLPSDFADLEFMLWPGIDAGPQVMAILELPPLIDGSPDSVIRDQISSDKDFIRLWAGVM